MTPVPTTSITRSLGLVLAAFLVASTAIPFGAVAASADVTDQGNGAPAADVLQTPPVYASKDGVLHVRMKATPTRTTINGKEYPNVYTFATKVVDGQGAFTPGTASKYVGPQLQVEPGDRLIIDFVNALPKTAFQPLGADEPQMVAQPLNLHTHGLAVSPTGNSDNVLLSIPQRRSNRYVIDIPVDQYHGLYWYHPHLHGLADDQVYQGLAGHIVVGRADGDYREFDGLTVRSMMIRYNVARPNDAGELIDASPYDTRGTASGSRGPMIYTVNGQVAPSIKLNPADPATGRPPESQVWTFTNITGSATYVIALEEVDAADATDASVVGKPLDLTVVSVDGTPMPAPKVLTGTDATRGYLLPQGGRVAVLVQGASDPSKVVRLVQVENRSGTGSASAYNWPEQEPMGGWRDYTRTVLAVSSADRAEPGTHVDTPPSLHANYDFEDQALETATVDGTRTFVFNSVATPTESTPNNFPINGGLFPGNRLDQPRAGTVEEWTILNYSSLHHPFHLHVQYGKVMEIVAPINPDYRDAPDDYPSVQYVTDLGQASPASFNQDVVNVPPALIDADGNPVLGPDGIPAEPGKVVLRVRFADYLGTYVEHCHRLPHEDRGMMSLVRTIPHDPVFAVTSTAADAPSVAVVRSSDLQTIATLNPFVGRVASLRTAVGDVDGDAIPDVAVASGVGPRTGVKVYSGASEYEDVIREVRPFGRSTEGANVALGDLNADGRDDVVVGDAARGRGHVVVFDGDTGTRLADFQPYGRITEGVSVAAGMVEEGGRVSLLTGAGAGGRPTVKMFNFDLFGDADGRFPDVRHTLEPLEVASFDGADADDDGGISVSTGYPFAAAGGFATVLVTTASGPASLNAYALTRGDHHSVNVAASGTVRPHAYQPGSPRTPTLLQHVQLSTDPALQRGAVTGALSTPTGALLVVAPADGGPLSTWGVDADGTIGQLANLAIDGVSVSAI
jgi:FtsP/CotA-like multicopper oxidase with cupredoxin domain